MNSVIIVIFFLEKLFRYIVKWTNNKCPKSKIAIKFFRKKHKKTILLEDGGKKRNILKSFYLHDLKKGTK